MVCCCLSHEEDEEGKINYWEDKWSGVEYKPKK